MKQFTLSLVKNSLRPVVKLEGWNNSRALVDTGAFFPIWTAEESMLNESNVRNLRIEDSNGRLHILCHAA